MDKAPAKFDYLAWWTSIPGIPAGWPEPKLRSSVIALHPAQPERDSADLDELPAAA